jgi:alkanesulfonate monooxygenase SsuD/methylene tetrahydromethanopterin reductase-like flavin-dependent oxidoreductase (luciferase family)
VVQTPPGRADGLSCLWASDIQADAQATQRPCLEAWTLDRLAPLTARHGSGRWSPAAYRHPSLLAKAVASLDLISQGRVDCGLGAGWNAAECRAYGIPFPPVGTRIAQLREAVQVLRRLWTHDRASFPGQYYTLDEAVGMPKPRQQPLPLWIGGQGEKSLLRLVAEAADGWNMVPGSRGRGVRCRGAGRRPHTLGNA